MYAQKKQLEQYLYTCVHGSIVHGPKGWRQLRCPPMDEWMSHMWSSHTMEYYSALRRMEIVTLATTWMKPEDIMLCKISQSRKG